VRSLSATDPNSTEPGLVITNPPYGIRVGEAAKLRDLYARFGQILRRNRPAWRLSMLSANPRLERELRLPLEEKLRTQNGGIPVRLVMSRVAAAGEP
jgi:23S rRNA G2445 N2-methylase RlmL